MKNWSLRTRLTWWSAAITGFALLTFGGVVAATLYFDQVHRLDRRLRVDSQVFFTELREHGVPKETDEDDAMLLLQSGARTLAFAFGLTSDPALHIYPLKTESIFDGWPGKPGFSTTHYKNKRLRLGVFRDGEFTLILASDLHPVEDSVLDVLVAYMLALPVVLIVVAAGSWWNARRALQPIAMITRAAASITAERLDARLPLPKVNDEIGQHILVLNDMFDRLQRGFEQATRFTADASHELRTPLTILRGEIEGALRLERLGAAEEDVFVSLLDQVQGLQKISDNLLLLARFDAGKTQIARERVDLSGLVTDATEDAELLASPTGLEVSAEVAAGVFVAGDPLLLRRLLLNLIDNAVRYNRPKGSVRLSLKRTESASPSKAEAVFTLANTGSGIPEKRRGELFKRFFRLDADRNHATGGTGLGLSLCREIAVAHGGRIELTRGGPDETEFTVTLPTES